MIVLHGAALHVQTLVDGRNNLSFQPTQTEALASRSMPETTPTESNSGDWSVEIGGLDLKDAQLTLQNDQTQSSSDIQNLNIAVGRLGKDIWVPLSFDMQGINNELNFNFKGNASIRLEKDLIASQLKELSVAGGLSQGELHVDTFTLSSPHFSVGQESQIKILFGGKNLTTGFDLTSDLTLNIAPDLQRINASELSARVTLRGEHLPHEIMQIGLDSPFVFDQAKSNIQFENVRAFIDDVQFTGPAHVNFKDMPEIGFHLMSEKVDLDHLLNLEQPIDSNQASSETVENAPRQRTVVMSQLNNIEPDLSVLQSFDLSGKVEMKAFAVKGIQVEDVVADFTVNNGVLDVRQFDAKLYEGSIQTTAMIDTNQHPATYRFKNKIQGVQVQPLLIDAIDNGFLSGQGNININVSGQGLSSKRLRNGMTGKLGIDFNDGAVNGINVAGMLREAKAALKGKVLDTDERVKKTDFSGLTANFDISNGFIKTNDAKLEAPLLRARAEGQSNLLTETLDVQLFVSVVGSSKGQGGKDIDELKDLTIPVKLYGVWQAPEYKIDIKGLLLQNTRIEEKLKEKAEKGLQKLLGDHADDEGIKKITDGLLKGLFQ